MPRPGSQMSLVLSLFTSTVLPFPGRSPVPRLSLLFDRFSHISTAPQAFGRFPRRPTVCRCFRTGPLFPGMRSQHAQTCFLPVLDWFGHMRMNPPLGGMGQGRSGIPKWISYPDSAYAKTPEETIAAQNERKSRKPKTVTSVPIQNFGCP